MNADDQIDNRHLLRFAEEVKNHFAFLAVRGFQCVCAETTLVRFESSKIAFNIYHGRQSYEIGLDIDFLQTEESYSFSEILRLLNSVQAEQYRNFATHTLEGVVVGVCELAKLLRECFEAGVLNNLNLRSLLKLQRSELARKYALEVQLENVNRKSEDAWIKKDYAQVVKILSPLREHLSAIALGRLEYSKKHRNISAIEKVYPADDVERTTAGPKPLR